MTEASRGSNAPLPEERLDSWKEIAAYLRRGTRTVQRWASEQGLPVHRLWPPLAPAEGNIVLAILPFRNLSGDFEQEYFSDGLTEEMISQLARLAPDRLRVIARTSVMPYKRSEKKVDQIARELSADYVLEGTVRREGERVRITAQLIRPSGQAHVWAESYDRALSGILAVQADVAQATEHFQRAAELDPNYARAWLGLCDTYRLRGSWWGDLPPQQAFPRAKEAALQALKLDPTVGEAHAGLAWIHFVFDWDWANAEAEFKRGIQLSPNSRDTHSPYANFLRCMRRVEESRLHIERSLAIDPLSPLELGEAAMVCLSLGQTDRAGRFMQEAFQLDPDFPPAAWGLAVVHAEAGRFDQAIAAVEKLPARRYPTGSAWRCWDTSTS
jgi:TolB-like protein